MEVRRLERSLPLSIILIYLMVTLENSLKISSYQPTPFTKNWQWFIQIKDALTTIHTNKTVFKSNIHMPYNDVYYITAETVKTK